MSLRGIGPREHLSIRLSQLEALESATSLREVLIIIGNELRANSNLAEALLDETLDPNPELLPLNEVRAKVAAALRESIKNEHEETLVTSRADLEQKLLDFNKLIASLEGMASLTKEGKLKVAKAYFQNVGVLNLDFLNNESVLSNFEKEKAGSIAILRAAVTSLQAEIAKIDRFQLSSQSN